MAEAPKKWPRDLWLDAIWESDTVKPNERCVAYAFARYAGKAEDAWCSWDEVSRRTGIRSRDAVWRAIAGLVEDGWLKQIEPPRQHRSPVYRLTCPLDVRETDPSSSAGYGEPFAEPFSDVRENAPGVRDSATRGPGKRGQTSGIQDATTPMRDQIEILEERSKIAAASRSARRPSTSRADEAIAEATQRRTHAIAAKIVSDETFETTAAARGFLVWLLDARPHIEDIVAYVKHLADDSALGPLYDEYVNEQDEP